jgi:RNA polymerase sigma factor (sigma-70 family)
MNSLREPDGIYPPEMDMEALVNEYGDRLLRMCIVYLRDASLAEDAVQDTFMRAYRAYPRFRGECSMRTWLTGIAVNVCRSMLRSAWRRRVYVTDTIERLGEAYEMPDSTVTEAVMRLPARQREAVVMHYIEGLKIREIASVLNVPLQTVSSRLNRARENLRADLKEWYNEKR